MKISKRNLTFYKGNKPQHPEDPKMFKINKFKLIIGYKKYNLLEYRPVNLAKI